MHHLLQLGCVLPVTSCEVERSFSAFRRVKTVIRSCMGEERLSSLCLMHIHYEVHINSHIVVEEFIRKQPRRLFSSLYHKESNSKCFLSPYMKHSIRKWVLWILFYNIKCNINAIGFLFVTQHTTPLLYVKIHFGVLNMRGTNVSRFDTP